MTHTKIRIFKTIINIIGLFATLMGAVALWDLVLNNDWNGILPFITVVGFMAPGIALLIVGKQLNYALVDIDTNLVK
jgi:nicotinamide riboside transporter PnuC